MSVLQLPGWRDRPGDGARRHRFDSTTVVPLFRRRMPTYLSYHQASESSSCSAGLLQRCAGDPVRRRVATASEWTNYLKDLWNCTQTKGRDRTSKDILDGVTAWDEIIPDPGRRMHS